MTVRLAAALALTLAAQPALADEAKQRGGSDGGGRGSSSDAGARHHSGDSSAGSSHRGSSGGSSDRGYSGGSQPPLTDAQRRHPRAGTGTGYGGGNVRYSSPYYRSYYYGYYPGMYGYSPYDPFYYSGYYGNGYGYGYAPYASRYGYRRYRETGSIRLMVDPPETRVYVDGYYAGVADDFDGIFQRLNVSPGRHEIALKLEGYKTHKLKAYVPEDHTLKVHFDMVKGSGDDPTEQVVGDPVEIERYADANRPRYSEGRANRDEDEDDDAVEDERQRDGRGADKADVGRLVVDVRPGGASIYVDGEFRGTGRDKVRLKLAPGRHRIEVVHPGFRTAERDVEIRSGHTTDLELELDRS